MIVNCMKDKITLLITPQEFSLKSIAESGQCFRWSELSPNKYLILAYNRLLVAEQYDNYINLYCSEEDYDNIWRSYFDLDYDYDNRIERALSIEDKGSYVVSAIEFSRGIRILNQDPWETLITFILSQQNNIPRITQIVENLCRYCGDLLGDYEGRDYYAFPTAEQLLDHYTELKDLGVGFREKYVIEACKKVISGYDLDQLKHKPTEEVVGELSEFYGIGPKIANCVALFSLGHKDAFPRDVWINRIIDNYYGGEFNELKFTGYAGLIQQYMFYYERRSNHQDNDPS